MQKKPWEEDWSQPQGPTTVGTRKPSYQYEGPKAAADAARAQAEANPALIKAQLEKAQAEAKKAQADADAANGGDIDAVTLAQLKAGGRIKLSDLPPDAQGIVSGLLQGNLPAGQRSIASKTMLPYIKMAMGVDPNFSANTFSARQKATGQLADMKATGGYLTSLAANIDHSREEEAAINRLGNPGGVYGRFGGAALNNWLFNKNGPAGAQFDQANRVYSGEQVKSITGNVGTAGAGSALADRQEAQNAITASMPIDAQRAALRTGAIQNYQKFRDANDAYRRTMGTDIPQAMSPEQAAQLLHLMRLQDDGSEGPLPDGINPGFVALATGRAAPPSGGTGAPPSMPGGIPPITGGGGPTGPQSNPLNYAQGQYGDATNTEVAGATKSVPNELGIQFMGGLNSLFHAGASDERIRAYASQFGVDPSAQLAYRKANPGFRGSIPPTPGGLSIQVPVTDPMSKLANAMAGSPTGTFVGEAGNAAGAGIPQWTAAQLSGNPDLARARFGVAREMNPRAAIGGALVGAAAGNVAGEGLAASGLSKVPMLFRGLEGADRAAAIAPWAARAGDAGFGAITGATNAPEGQGGIDALEGAALGLGGGMMGRNVMKAAGSAMRGVSDPRVGYLADQGVPLTLGQTVGNSGFAGRAVKGVEDRLSGFPIIGDQIGKRIGESMEGFNRAAFGQFNDVAAPLSGQTVKNVGPLGVEAANRSIGGAYDNILGNVKLKADEPFTSDMRNAVTAGNALPEPMRARIQYTLPTRVGNSIAPDGSLSGNDFQQALRGLRRDASAVRSEPYGDDFGNVTGQAQDALTGMLERQSPGTLPQFNQANDAYRLKSVLQDAVNRARNGTRSKTTDVFTPSQLSDAAAANAKRFGGTQGTTNQPFFDLTRAGQDVLPNKVPDSGTAGRLSIPLALGGSAAGGAAVGQPIAGLAGGLFGTAIYSKTGQKALRNLLLTRPEILQQLGLGMKNAAPYGGALGSATLLQLSQP